MRVEVVNHSAPDCEHRPLCRFYTGDEFDRYSTVEPRSTAPGWQVNNDLSRYSVTTGEKSKILDASSGGVYGWWGMTFAFSADGRLAYARPDGIGTVDIDKKYLKPLLDILTEHPQRLELAAFDCMGNG